MKKYSQKYCCPLFLHDTNENKATALWFQLFSHLFFMFYFQCLLKFRGKMIWYFIHLHHQFLSSAQCGGVSRSPGFLRLNLRPRFKLSQLRLRLTVTNVGRLSLRSQNTKLVRRLVVSFKFHVWSQSRARQSTLVELWLWLIMQFILGVGENV